MCRLAQGVFYSGRTGAGSLPKLRFWSRGTVLIIFFIPVVSSHGTGIYIILQQRFWFVPSLFFEAFSTCIIVEVYCILDVYFTLENVTVFCEEKKNMR
jgi:hypothetical protein